MSMEEGLASFGVSADIVRFVVDPPRLSWLFHASCGSCRHPNAPSQQVEAGAAVALPLQRKRRRR